MQISLQTHGVNNTALGADWEFNAWRLGADWERVGSSMAAGWQEVGVQCKAFVSRLGAGWELNAMPGLPRVAPNLDARAYNWQSSKDSPDD